MVCCSTPDTLPQALACFGCLRVLHQSLAVFIPCCVTQALGNTCRSSSDSTTCKLEETVLQEVTPTCASCWGYHDLGECCCGGDTPQDVVWKPSAQDPDTELGTCPNKLCRAAVQHYVGTPVSDQDSLSAAKGLDLKAITRRPQYSFKAEQSLFAPADISDHKSGKICTGVSGKGVPALPLSQSSTHAPEATLLILRAMGDAIRSWPAFADLFTCFEKDKLEFVKRAKPCMYVGTGEGIRSSFCACVKDKMGRHLKTITLKQKLQKRRKRKKLKREPQLLKRKRCSMRDGRVLKNSSTQALQTGLLCVMLVADWKVCLLYGVASSWTLHRAWCKATLL